MENTLENKAKFFAQYWGQEVGRFYGSVNKWEYGRYLGCDYLELKAISQIKDENSLTPHQFDYLRSKGYALPYMGLSVEKQIEYGWVKLIQ